MAMFVLSARIAVFPMRQEHQRLGAAAFFSPQRLHCMHTFSRTDFVMPTKAMATEVDKNSPVKFGKEAFQVKSSSFWEMAPPSLQKFPWEKAYKRLLQRLADLFWTAAKLLAIPSLIVSALTEIYYAVSVNKEFLIPLGLLGGIVLAGIMKETALELLGDLQETQFPWHIAVIGGFFALLKLLSPYPPVWIAAFLPHFSNGGLLQTIHFIMEWQKSHNKDPSAGKTSAYNRRENKQ